MDGFPTDGLDLQTQLGDLEVEKQRTGLVPW